MQNPYFTDISKNECQCLFFSNARTVRNAVDRARMRAAIRLFNKAIDKRSNGLVSRKELMTLEKEDFVTVEELILRGDNAIVE